MTRTTGELFPDGASIELLRDSQSGGPTLLFYDGEKPTIAPWIKAHGHIYAPADIDPSVLRALTLPSTCSPYGTTRELFKEIFDLISRVTCLSDGIVTQIACFVFATWLADCLPLAPLLWVIAPPTAPSGALLQLLGLLSRRAILVTELTAAGLRTLSRELRPTILTEVVKPTRAFVKVLRTSSRQGTYMAAGDRVIDVSCGKIIFANEPLRDSASAGYPLEIALSPTRDYLPPMDPADAERIAAEFQAKLLLYRIVNHSKVAAQTLNLSELTPPTQELAHSLAACIVDDDELQSQIVPLLRPRDREIQVDRAAMLESIVLEALLSACHEKLPSALPIVGLTQRVNTILAGRGETLEISPENVGWKLRALGLRTEFITGGRKGLALHSETRATIHRLAAAYGVRTLRQLPANNCSDCAALEMWQMPRTDAPSNSIEEST